MSSPRSVPEILAAFQAVMVEAGLSSQLDPAAVRSIGALMAEGLASLDGALQASAGLVDIEADVLRLRGDLDGLSIGVTEAHSKLAQARADILDAQGQLEALRAQIAEANATAAGG